MRELHGIAALIVVYIEALYLSAQTSDSERRNERYSDYIWQFITLISNWICVPCARILPIHARSCNSALCFPRSVHNAKMLFSLSFCTFFYFFPHSLLFIPCGPRCGRLTWKCTHHHRIKYVHGKSIFELLYFFFCVSQATKHCCGYFQSIRGGWKLHGKRTFSTWLSHNMY